MHRPELALTMLGSAVHRKCPPPRAVAAPLSLVVQAVPQVAIASLVDGARDRKSGVRSSEKVFSASEVNISRALVGDECTESEVFDAPWEDVACPCVALDPTKGTDSKHVCTVVNAWACGKIKFELICTCFTSITIYIDLSIGDRCTAWADVACPCTVVDPTKRRNTKHVNTFVNACACGIIKLELICTCFTAITVCGDPHAAYPCMTLDSAKDTIANMFV